MSAHKNFYSLLVLFLLLATSLVSLFFLLITDEAPVKDPAEEQTILATPEYEESLEKVVGGLFMIGHWADSPLASTTELIRKYHFAGVIIMSSPDNPNDIKDWVEEWNRVSEKPLLITIDQEGGPVNRLKGAEFIQTGQRAITTPEEAYAVGFKRGQELSALGINMNFAPVLDSANNPDSFMYERVFPEGSDIVLLSSELTRGLSDAGVIAAAKHFPGHDDTNEDSHFTLPSVAIEKASLPEFTENFISYIEKTKPQVLMTAHVLFPKIDVLPATLSHYFLTDYLRTELGFTGVIITDDMSMDAIDETWSSEEASTLTLIAGADMILFAAEPARTPAAYASVMSAVNSGRLLESDIRNSYGRIHSLFIYN